MKNMYRLATLTLITLLLSACSGKKVELDRNVFETQKIEVVRVEQIESGLSAEISTRGKEVGKFGGVSGFVIGSLVDANTNSVRARSLAPLSKALSNYDINQQISDSLAKQLKGRAFTEQVRLDTSFDPKRKAYLTPQIMPNVIMAADYSSVTVILEVFTYQNKDSKQPHKGTYTATAEHALDEQGKEISKEDNFQYWADNPEILIDNINQKIDEAVSQFAQDFNSPDGASLGSDAS